MLVHMPAIFLVLYIAFFQSSVKNAAPAANSPAQAASQQTAVRPTQAVHPQLTAAEIARLQSTAAGGNAVAQYNLALAYQNGNGVPKDLKLTFDWCKKAAEQDNADAETALGVMYRSGEGVDEDLQAAVQWYEKASRQGNPSAMFDLGAAYYNGDGVPVDDSLSYAWFVLAKEAGSPQAVQAVGRAESDLSPFEITVGYRRLAEICTDGKYAPVNRVEAASWALKAATLGDPPSQLRIAQMFLEGQGVAQDFGRARYWCSRAAKGGGVGDRGGDYCLGYIYQHGLGVPANPKAARKWYKLAANAGLASSIRALARMEESGQGAKPDLMGAAVLYAELAMSNDKDALQQVIRLRNKMSAKDWKEVQKRCPNYSVDPQKLKALLHQTATH
ncbi:MAG: tetratricopeptide repeat protein [Candidatus Acidiferrales bacterium]